MIKSNAVHVAEEALSWTSIGILTTFAAELVAKLAVFGHAYFTHSKCAPCPSRSPAAALVCGGE